MFAFVFSLFHLLTEPSLRFESLYDETENVPSAFEDIKTRETSGFSTSIIPNPFVRCREATTTDCRWTPEPILVDGTAWFVDGSADLKKEKEVGKLKKKIFWKRDSL